MLGKSDVTDLVDRLLGDYESQRGEVEKLDRWYRGRNDRPHMPKTSSAEYKELQTRSASPWLGLVVTNTAQALFVDGYREARSADNAKAWEYWQRNGMDARQTAVHRAALAHGLSYATVLPGDQGPVIRGVSARKMFAVYDDPAEDEWPRYAIRAEVSKIDGERHWMIRLYDDQAVYIASCPVGGGRVEYLDTMVHNVGVCPVVRFSNMLDLDGRSMGEVEPFIPLAARIDQDTFDRLVVQRFGAWLVRYIAGLAKPETDAEQRAQKMRLLVEDLLVAEDPDTKFGALPATPLDGFISARDADIRDLAAVSQTPPQYLLGQMVNISADALAAAESSLMRKVGERKTAFGESWEQTLRLAAHVDGDTAAADDFTTEVRWRDTESRSLSTTADALGKLATMLQVPPEALWERVPGVSDQDVQRWKALKDSEDGMNQIADLLAGSAQGANPSGGEPAAGAPRSQTPPSQPATNGQPVRAPSGRGTG